MDYKDLLKKYIRHIRDCEGIEYLEEYPSDILTKEELKELQDISDTTYPIDYSKGPFSRSTEWTDSIRKVILEDMESMKHVKVIEI